MSESTAAMKAVARPGRILAVALGVLLAVPGAAGAVEAGTVKLTKDAVDVSAGNLLAYKIETPAATYYLEKEGAGLSSMIDREGNDWISFSAEVGSGPRGESRGFPNAVYYGRGIPGWFHPKNQGTGVHKTAVVENKAGHVAITAESADGRWAARYDFLPGHCTFTMTRVPEGETFWVLYEGAPGGVYEDTDWWITSGSRERSPMTTRHDGDIPAPEWIAFGDDKVQRTLLLVHHTDDEHPDTFYQMRSAMTVFGFGRERLNKFLDKEGAAVSIAFVESQDADAVGKAAEAILRPSSGGRL